MSTPTRSFLSASIGPGFTVCTVLSAALNGPLGTVTMVAFGLTVAWSIVEIALFSYTPIAAIELEGPSLLEESPDGASDAATDPSASNVVSFSDPTPWRQRAA